MTPVRAMFDRWYEDTDERFVAAAGLEPTTARLWRDCTLEPSRAISSHQGTLLTARAVPLCRQWSMWGGAWQHRFPHSSACWDWDGDPDYWQHTYDGLTCERNWLAGAVGGGSDRPFQPDSPALLGFDETINEFCSEKLGLQARAAKLCHRCYRRLETVTGGAWLSRCATDYAPAVKNGGCTGGYTEV